MFRALLISLALHLVLLISPPPARLGGIAPVGGEQALRLMLRTGGDSPVNSRVLTTVEREDIHRAIRQLPESGSALKTREPAKISPFLPSTVAFAASGRDVDQNSFEAEVGDRASLGDGEREYRLNLAREARRLKGYPNAGYYGQGGEVHVALSMLIGSRWPEAQLLRSSGNAELDRLAIELLEQAVKMAAIPPELQGKRFRIVVPIEYRPSEQ